MFKILVAEDDPVSAKMLRDFLSAHGYSVSHVENGPDAVTSFQEEEPDLMIVDVALPRQNGFEVCFEVKRTAEGRTMPVILMSAVYLDSTAEKYAEDLQADAFFRKPFDLRDLLVRVRELLPSTGL